jgi:hypothetical protein
MEHVKPILSRVLLGIQRGNRYTRAELWQLAILKRRQAIELMTRADKWSCSEHVYGQQWAKNLSERAGQLMVEAKRLEIEALRCVEAEND